MKNLIRCLPIFLCLLTLAGCGENVSTEAYYNLDKMPHGLVLLNRWQILGPFPANGNTHYIGVDNLRQFGLDEKTVTYAEFTNIQPKDSSERFINRLYTSDDYKTDFNKLYHIPDSLGIAANVYCACILHSDRPRKLKLNFSSDDGSQVWFDHKLIYSSGRMNGIEYYQNYLTLNISKGNNLLLVKVNNLALGWQMFADVEKETKWRLERYLKTFSVRFGRYYLQRSTLTGDTIELNKDLPSDRFGFILRSPAGKTILSDSGSNASKAMWVVPGLKDGLYSTTFYDRHQIFHEELYKGHIVRTIGNILRKLKAFRLTGDEKNDLAALKFRFYHLLVPKNMGKTVHDKRNWDKKMIFLFTNLRRCYSNLNRGFPMNHDATGGMLLTYVSKIDGGVQYYQLFVPKQYRKANPLPLVVELPVYVLRHSSPLSTYRFANIRLFGQFEHLADKYDVIVLSPDCRIFESANMNTISDAAFWEVLANVRTLYDVDTTRLYLRGACLASMMAMSLAEKYPDKFAALAMVSPQLSVSRIDNIYLQQNEPLNYLRNISNLPTLDIHSRLDHHSPVSISDKLYADVTQLGFKHFTYKRLRFEFQKYYSSPYLSYIFAFFLKHHLQPGPHQIFFSTSEMRYSKSFWLTLNGIKYGQVATIHAKIRHDTLRVETRNIRSYTINLKTLPYREGTPLIIYNNDSTVFDAFPHTQSLTFGTKPSDCLLTKNPEIEGPFADVFTVPFAVVPGTIGSAHETQQMRALADTIDSYWKERYYSGCRIIPDRDVTRKAIGRYSLLLLGTPHSNIVYRRLASQLPIKITPNSVRIAGHVAEGSKLGFYFIYPNPEDRHNYVAIIGYNNPGFISLGYEMDGPVRRFDDVSDYGWYDYKIWSSVTFRTIKSGYLNFFWK